MPKKRKASEGLEPSPWYPELSPEVIDRAKKAEKAGSGALLARLQRIGDQRLELRAIQERWPIPRDLREKMVIDAATIAADPTKELRYRLTAAKILLAMDAANRTKDLPDQVLVQVNNNTVQVTVQDILKTIEEDPRFDSLMDAREVRAIPGGADDYAE
jgi:hypothetical protein